VFYPLGERSKQNIFPPWLLAEGVRWAATLNSFNYTYYHFFMMHGVYHFFYNHSLSKRPRHLLCYIIYRTCILVRSHVATTYAECSLVDHFPDDYNAHGSIHLLYDQKASSNAPFTLQNRSQGEIQVPFRPPVPPLVKLHSPGHLSTVTQPQTWEMVVRPRIQLSFPRRRSVICRLGYAPRFHACRLSRV